MNKENLEIINRIKDLASSYAWVEIVLEINFTQSGGYGLKSHYLNTSGKHENLPIPLRLIRPYLKNIIEKVLQSKNTGDELNKVILVIDKHLGLDLKYSFSEENVLEQKINSSKVFYQWLNETMMNRIFDYEKENNLLTPVYDEDGALDYYESSYDKGIFNFRIQGNQVFHKLELIKDHISRDLNMSLPEYIGKGILEHHHITNNELKDKWKPWNSLVIKSPNNNIPYNNWEEYVEYKLEVVNGESFR